MKQQDYNKIIERIKSAVELSNDYNNMQRCQKNLLCYDRINAWQCLQELFQEYEIQINTLGYWTDGMQLVKVNFADVSDHKIKEELNYLREHIPMYVLLREGEKECAKRVCEWFDKNTNR